MGLPSQHFSISSNAVHKSGGTVAETGSPIIFNLPTGVRVQGVAVVDLY